MCRKTKCSKCGKPSWAGCGAHVEQVLGGIPLEDRCNCEPSSIGLPKWLKKLLGG